MVSRREAMEMHLYEATMVRYPDSMGWIDLLIYKTSYVHLCRLKTPIWPDEELNRSYGAY
jgi:hypothetical protein